MAVPFQDVQGFTPASTDTGLDWAKLLQTVGAAAKDIGTSWSGGQSNALGQMIQGQAVDDQERRRNEAVMSALSFLNPGGDKDPDHAGAARALAGAPGMANAALQFAMSAPRPERWEDVSMGGGGTPGAAMGGAPAGGAGAAGQQPELIVQDWIHNLIPQQGGTQQQGGPFRSGAGQSNAASLVNRSSFDDLLGMVESTNNYGIVNDSGYSGKYQMGERALADIGVYQDDNLKDNKWNGRFVGLPGVQTHAEFLASPEAQEAAYQRHKARLEREIDRRGLDQYIGQTVNGTVVTRDGLLGAMHLGGAHGAEKFIRSGGAYNPSDAKEPGQKGKRIGDYLAQFGAGDGGRVQVADAGGFTVPQSTARAVNGGQSDGWVPPFRMERNARNEPRFIDRATNTVFKPTDKQMEYIHAVISGSFRGSPLAYERAKAEATQDTTTPVIREWRAAVQQGFNGSLMDYQAEVAARTRDNTTGDMKEWRDAVARGHFNGSLIEYQKAKNDAAKTLPGGSVRRSLTPFYVTDENGNQLAATLGEDGTAQLVDLPPGMSLSPGVQKVDGGPVWWMVDRAGNVVSTLPKDLAEAERQKNLGKSLAERQAEAPKVMAQADQMLATIDNILNDENLRWATGKLSFTSNIPGTGMYDFGQKVEQLKGQAFLQAFESLKGGGQITEVEGIKATNAIGRLNQAQTEEGFRQALSELRDIVVTARKRAEGVGSGQPGQNGGAQQPASPQAQSTDKVFNAVRRNGQLVLEE